MADEKVLRLEIRKKLKEFGSDTDGLAEYIAVMMANKRDKDHVLEDLDLFLTPNTMKFVDWLFSFVENANQSTIHNIASESDEYLLNKSLKKPVDSKSDKANITDSSNKTYQVKLESIKSSGKREKCDEAQVSNNKRIGKKIEQRDQEKLSTKSEDITERKRHAIKKSFSDAINVINKKSVVTVKASPSVDSIEKRQHASNPGGESINSMDSSLLQNKKAISKRSFIDFSVVSSNSSLASDRMDNYINIDSLDLREVLNRKRKTADSKIPVILPLKLSDTNTTLGKRKNLSSPSNCLIGTGNVSEIRNPPTDNNSVRETSNISLSLDELVKKNSCETHKKNREENKKERCKFWPMCRDMSRCEFFHPIKTCSSFPACKFGKNCLFIHPVCKFNNRCNNSKCPYLHFSPSAPCPAIASSTNLQQTKWNSSEVYCFFGEKCSKARCTFRHPDSKTNTNLARVNPSALKWRSSGEDITTAHHDNSAGLSKRSDAHFSDSHTRPMDISI